MPRLRLALCLILAIPLLSACKTVRIHTHNPPGHAYGHKKHKPTAAIGTTIRPGAALPEWSIRPTPR